MIQDRFIYQRKIRLRDTDTAGVVYFAHLLSMCHEAYEEYLVSLNINLSSFFREQQLAVPIIHSEIDFFKPLYWGDIININLQGKIVNTQIFEIFYEVAKENIQIAKASTRHICINSNTRNKTNIPSELLNIFTN